MHSAPADFLKSIEPFIDGYLDEPFSYVAVLKDGHWVMVQGNVLLRTDVPESPPLRFKSQNVIAGRHTLRSLGKTIKSLIDEALTGEITVPEGKLSFPKGSNGMSHAMNYDPLHAAGLNHRARYNVLRIWGDHRSNYFSPPLIDWELRASATPYDTLGELGTSFGAFLNGDMIGLEIVGLNVAAIDMSSEISAPSSTIRIRIANGLDPKAAAFGFRIIQRGDVLARGMVTGDAMDWVEEERFLEGSFKIDTPSTAVVHGIVSYAGLAQNFYWMADPSTYQNPRRAVYEAVDPKLAILNEILEKAGERGFGARELETAVGSLLWMIGFSINHLGGTARLQEAADLLVTTPSGNIALIECTTAHLKPDTKLPLLASRVLAVRKNLDATFNRHVDVLGIVVTSLSRADVDAEIERAHKLGVSVVTREDLYTLIERSLLLNDPDEIFQVAVNSTKAPDLLNYTADNQLTV